MAEITLSALPSASVTQQVQSVPLSTPSALAQPQLPPAIAALPNGALLEGFVINRDAQGNPILRTGKGDFLVQVQHDLFLKTGSEVIIRLSVQGGQTSATLVSVDTQPVSQLIQQQAAAQQQASVATRTTLPAPNAPLQAVLLSAASFGSEQQTQQILSSILRIPVAQLPAIEKGLSLQFTLLPPATTAAPLPATLPQSAQVPIANAPQTATAYVPPNANATPPSAPVATVSAAVIGHEGNETIVRSAIGTLKLYTPAPLAVGSQITLGYVPQSAVMPTSFGIFTAPQSISQPATSGAQGASSLLQSITHASQLGEDWENLREAIQLLSPSARAAGAHAGSEIASRIPNTKSDIVNQALFFLSALRGGDIQQWLGKQSSDSLKVQSSRLLDRLGADFSALRTSAAPQPDMPWQMLIFPMLHEEALHQARLFWRHENSNDENAEAASANETRFVFDLTLSQLGALQIDGLVKGQRPDCSLHVVIRSEIALSQGEQDDLRGLYASASEAAGLSGQLRFTSGKAQLLSPLSELRAAAAHGDAGSILA